MKKTIKLEKLIEGLTKKIEGTKKLVSFTDWYNISLENQLLFAKMLKETYIEEMETEGFYYTNEVLWDYNLTIWSLHFLSNIDIEKDGYVSLSYEDYTLLIQQGILSKYRVADDFNLPVGMLEQNIQQELKIKNSVAYMLNRKIDTILENLPNAEEMKSMVDNMPMVMEAIKNVEGIDNVNKLLNKNTKKDA